MKSSHTTRVRRHLAIISLLKEHPHLSSKSMERSLREGLLKASTKTLQRDIAWMQDTLKAPIEYDASGHGYCLTDQSWTYPTGQLEDDAIFASLFAHHLTAPFLPPTLQEPLAHASRVLLAARTPDVLPQSLLRSLIQATSSRAIPRDALFEDVLEAWRACRVLRIVYRNESERLTSREIEPHALFLAAGAWYIRAWCRLRKEIRSFAIHRCREVHITAITVTRNPSILAGVTSGNPFDYREVCDVILSAAAAKAPVIREREWFPGQSFTSHQDGSLTLRFPSVPEPFLVRWILSFAPHLTVIQPLDLRQTIFRTASQLRDLHTPDSVCL